MEAEGALSLLICDASYLVEDCKDSLMVVDLAKTGNCTCKLPVSGNHFEAKLAMSDLS